MATLLTLDVFFARRQCNERIQSKLVVIIEVFITQRDTKDPLTKELRNMVIDKAPVSVIREAFRETFDDREALIQLPMQQYAAVRGEVPAVKSSLHLAASKAL